LPPGNTAYIKERLPIQPEMAGQRPKVLYIKGFFNSGRGAGFALAILID
jgi:hypothetical protein